MHPSLLPAPELIDPLLLTEIAAGLAHALSLEDPPPERTPPQLLLRTNRYTAWYLGWSAGTAWTAHDRASGVLHVVRGELVERRDELAHLPRTDRIVRAGDAIALGTAMATRIENVRRASAWVVHVTDAADDRGQLRLVS